MPCGSASIASPRVSAGKSRRPGFEIAAFASRDDRRLAGVHQVSAWDDLEQSGGCTPRVCSPAPQVIENHTLVKIGGVALQGLEGRRADELDAVGTSADRFKFFPTIEA
jgi:hypothetical protein